MDTINIIICDDDMTYAETCKSQLYAVAKKYGIEVSVDIVESGDKLVFFIDTKYSKADLIYLDYNMPGLNGLQTARLLRENGILVGIIFVTKDESHALEGYDVAAIAYLVKGKTDKAKFEKTFLRAVRRLKMRNSEIMTFSYCGEQRHVYISDILYFEVRGQKVMVHYLRNGKTEKFEFYSTLTQIFNQLAERGFERSHRSYLVALKHIYRKAANHIEMVNGDVIPIGREYMSKFR
jgi:DNA-binding LytR/AlgR family response regulator